MNKEPNLRAPLDRMVVRPGLGWKHIAGSVYEHSNGTRVHTMGFVRFPNGDFLNDSKWPWSHDAARMIRINGGNRRRGLMAWAMVPNKIIITGRGE